MTELEALRIVLELAEQNVIVDSEMEDEEARQREAITIVEEMAERLVME
jgi:hypothetical protein